MARDPRATQILEWCYAGIIGKRGRYLVLLNDPENGIFSRMYIAEDHFPADMAQLRTGGCGEIVAVIDLTGDLEDQLGFLEASPPQIVVEVSV